LSRGGALAHRGRVPPAAVVSDSAPQVPASGNPQMDAGIDAVGSPPGAPSG
jgi:hypothetical protein